MMKIKSKISPGMWISPWIVLGTTAILIVVVLALAIQNMRRDRRYMSQVLSTKGAALILAVEAGTRTGMMGMMWGGDQVQRLLEETAQLPDVLYMAVLDADGTILAHSNREHVGQPFRKENPVIHYGAEFEENWEVISRPDNRRVFEVHRHFRPLPPRWKGRPREGMPGMLHRPRKDGEDWLDVQQSQRRLIVIGLDVAPFEQVINDDIRNTIILSMVLLLLGFAGFLSLFWMHSYRITRRSLQDTSAFADEVVSSLPVGLIATDRNGRIAVFNTAAAKISGIDSTRALGQNPDRVLPSQLCGLKASLDQGVIIREREMMCAFHEDKVPVSVSATRIVNENNEAVGHILILRDLVEVHRLQAEIRRQEKLAALGGLAAGVAHEIRNPLSSIKGLATYFGEKFAPQSEDRNLAQVMIQEVDRLNRVISELLEFARPTDIKRRPYDLNGLLQHCLQLVHQDAADKQIEIQSHLTSDLCRVDVDPDRMSQCILNLYLNAIEAMAPQGRLTVTSEQAVNQQVKIQIGDTGHGIAAPDLEQIFNPYFTTKSKGTGLGLAIVHKIVEAHDGHIQVESIPGEGTRFILTLPCRDQEQESA
jgi:two-component system sensor histidine kinase HydH